MSIQARSPAAPERKEAGKSEIRRQKPTLESRFCDAVESTFLGLEKPSKNPIFSTACQRRLCARLASPFMAQINLLTPFFHR
jgi:hypothetical protein